MQKSSPGRGPPLGKSMLCYTEVDLWRHLLTEMSLFLFQDLLEYDSTTVSLKSKQVLSTLWYCIFKRFEKRSDVETEVCIAPKS